MNKNLLNVLLCLLALAAFGCSPQLAPVQETPPARASPTSEPSPIPTVQPRRVCAGGSLNIRSAANAKASIIGTLKDGENLIPVSGKDTNSLSMQSSADGGQWLEVRTIASSLHGWVNSRYLCSIPTPEIP